MVGVQEPSPGNQNQRTALEELDELFVGALHYESTHAYRELMKFVGRFRSYSPFNAMLAHAQMPGAQFVAPADRWRRVYNRRIRPGSRPIVLLRPRGPVVFVYDVSDTEPLPGAKPLPPLVEGHFVGSGRVGAEFERSVENAKRDGVRVIEGDAGSLRGGHIQKVMRPWATVEFPVRLRPRRVCKVIPVQYDIVLNKKKSRESKYLTLVHELAHLYCGHLGTPDERRWPDRSHLSQEVEEFEAESVAHLIACRLGISSESAAYLWGYLADNRRLPHGINLDRILKAAGLIEEMGRRRMKARR